MELYAGLDLHSRNTYIAIMDTAFKRVFKKRVANDLDQILQVLGPFQNRLSGFVVESSFNWYWLVDGLMDAGYGLNEIHSIQRLKTIENRLRQNIVERRIFGHEINAANQSLLAINQRINELLGRKETPAKARGLNDLNYDGQATESDLTRQTLVKTAEQLEASENPYDQALAKTYREAIISHDTKTGELNKQIDAGLSKTQNNNKITESPLGGKQIGHHIQEQREANQKIRDESKDTDVYE